MDIFQTNVVGCVLVYQTFVPLLERSKRPGGPVLVNISSGSGSITKVQHPRSTSYCISKAALNMLVCLALPWNIGVLFIIYPCQTIKQAFENPNIIIMAMAPGWVKTGQVF